MPGMARRPRHRLVALAATALVALVAGAVAGSGGPQPTLQQRIRHAVAQAPQRAAPRIAPRRLAGAVIVERFHGSALPAYVARDLAARRAAGVILFRENAPAPGPTAALTRAIRRAAPDAIVCTDQEGGAIRTLSWAPPSPPQSGIPSPVAAAVEARAAAAGLRRAGVNVTLAPVADLSAPGTLMRSRAFPGGPAQVARIVAAAVRAYRGTGVLPTVKHFPGLGGATANTDLAPVTIATAAATLGATDLPPFQAAIAAGVPLVMVSHALYPALDPRNVASQSPAIVEDLLRRRLGFRGVAMTDSLEARAVSSRLPPGRAAIRSVRAGVDLILTTGAGSHVRVLRALSAEARRDPAFRARLAQAATRVAALRRSLAPHSGKGA
jgi:beta-N-acetylhexosaminidase